MTEQPILEETVILVDEHDHAIGQMEKLTAHQKGLLHRAFSVFIFNRKGELLLQRRAARKYHSAGLWTNTCCSHPRPEEALEAAANRRLQEEMGMNCDLSKQFSFIYRADFPNGLIEHEFDHVFFGLSDLEPIPNKAEVEEWRYVSLESLSKEIDTQPEAFTAWLRISLNKVISRLREDHLF